MRLHASSNGFNREPNLRRRQFLHVLAAVMVALPVLPHMAWAHGAANVSITESATEFEKFMALCKQVIATDSLDEETGKNIMQVLKQEKWGADHLRRVLQKFEIAEKRELSPSDALASLNEGEQWFVGHVLTTWITGIYFHLSGNKVISYKHALMYESFRDIYPEPYLCDSHFGYWQQPPV